tara:strand:- start:32179 stop:36024 length:3846 start_codon:yes stop_codon:yes gene_type:complete
MFQRAIIFFFIFNLALVYAQQSDDAKDFKFNDIKNVLADEWISDFMQDNDGFIWAATQDGLSKYNGKNFKTYRYNPLEKNSLPSNWIRTIHQDKNGIFWIGTYGAGLVKFDEKKGTFENVEIKCKNATVNSRLIYNVFISSSGAFWVVTEDGLFRKSQTDANFVSLTKPFISIKVFELENGTEVVAYDNKLFKYNSDEERLELLLNPSVIHDIKNIGNNNIIYKSAKELYLYDFINSPQKIDLPNNDDVLHLSNVKDNRCIIIGTSGNYTFNTTTKSFQPYDYNLEKFKTLGITSLFIDRQNLLWIATQKGLFKESVLNKVFTNHFDIHARRILVDSSTIFITGNQGFFKVSKSNTSNYQQYLNGTNITSLCKTEHGFWLGDMVGNIYIINNSNKIKTIALKKAKRETLRIFGIVEDLNGYLWISTWQGIYVMDSTGKIINIYKLDEAKEIKILKLILDKQDHLWANTVGEGLYKIPNLSEVDKNQNHINYKKYVYHKTDSTSINSNVIMDIHESKNGSIWVGSEFGVNIYNEEKDNFYPLKINGKIFDKKIMAIETDSHNLTWITTINNGIYIYNKEDETLFNLNEEDGLISNICLYTSSAIYKNEFYFGTDNGVQIINTSKFTYPSVTIKPSFSEMDVQGEFSKTFKDLAHTEQPITLNFNQNNFNISLEIADYRFPEKIDYYYKLDEATNFWTKVEGNKINFNNINYGVYNLLVKAAYQATDNAPVTKLGLKIKPPWYKSALAYTLLFIGFAIALSSFFQLRYKQKLASNKLKVVEEMDRVKSNLFTNISHELRTPLTLISGPIEHQLSKKHLKIEDRETLGIVKQNADRLLNLVNQMTDLSLIDSGQIKLKIEQGNLGIILKQLVSAFQYKANEKEINIESNIAELDSCWFDKDIIEKIGTNLLSNAIKYSPIKTTVYFTAQQQNNQLQLSVVNQNNQIKADKLGQLFQKFYQNNETSEGIGVGLALVKDLVSLSKGTILANTLEDDKIQFNITLPIDKDAFEAFELIETTEEIILPETNKTTNKDQPTIVIIDDELDILNFVASIFKDSYTVIKTTNSRKAIELIRKQLPDLVISDVMMPDISGLELCNQLKKNALTSHIPIILLTAKVTQNQKLEGLETGADAYVTKPFNADILKVRVNKLIETRAQLKQRFNEQPILTKALEVTSVEAEFMQRLKDVLDTHLVNPEFTTDAFGKYMLMSRTQLHRKLKAIVGMTTSEFIRSQRMQLARDVLKKQDKSVSEAAYLVGFNSVSYFIKCFKKSYNKTPSQYIEHQKL